MSETRHDDDLFDEANPWRSPQINASPAKRMWIEVCRMVENLGASPELTEVTVALDDLRAILAVEWDYRRLPFPSSADGSPSSPVQALETP